ncbi:MAG: LysR family transcriptional regulator [Verrucomicrobiaceae bacterium]|nr:MAG: LysR family transcriptional regulator [Verrucomicrobiaceae bacterium]
MELRHLRYFTAVAGKLSFRGAAEALHIAQPALSAQIRTLEDELGEKLFVRTTRSVRLTHAGRILLNEARNVLAAAEQARQRVQEAGHGLEGTLRLGFIAPSANTWLAGVLKVFRKRYPGVMLSLSDLTSTEQVRQLHDGKLDVALLRPPVGFPDLDYSFVEESPYILALPAGHRLARKKELGWADFHEEPMVMLEPNVQHGYYDPFLAACAKAGAFPKPAQFAKDIHTKMWLISAGFGMAPTTATLARIKRPGLVFRELPPGLPSVSTVLVWRRDDDSPILPRFRECFLERLPVPVTAGGGSPAVRKEGKPEAD